MKRNLLLSILLSGALALVLTGLAQDTGGAMMDDMTGGMMEGDMTGGMTGGAMMDDMTGGMSSEIDSMLEDLMLDSASEGGVPMADTSSMTIAQVVAADPDFGILAQLVQSAGLLETLDGEGPFTVFAPSDSAFLPFSNSDIVSLLGDTEALTNILTYHVVSGEVTSEDLLGMSSVTTLQGGELTVSEGSAMDMTGGMMDSGVTGGEMMSGDMTGGMMEDDISGGMTGGASSIGPSLMVGSATVVTADIETANGVIHVIDSVLVPGN